MIRNVRAFKYCRRRISAPGDGWRINSTITLVEYDPRRPELFAKPIVDLVLVVKNSADEAVCVPALEAAGYKLAIREPDWFQHRLFKGSDLDINLHVFGKGAADAAFSGLAASEQSRPGQIRGNQKTADEGNLAACAGLRQRQNSLPRRSYSEPRGSSDFRRGARRQKGDCDGCRYIT